MLQEHGAGIFVGDHVHDVEGALAAGALSVSVLTGGCTEEELRAAGTPVLLRDLAEFPAWLDEHVLELRLRDLDPDMRVSLWFTSPGDVRNGRLHATATTVVVDPDR